MRVFSTRGEIQHHTAKSLIGLFREALIEDDVIFDLSQVSLMSSWGMGILVAAKRFADRVGKSFSVAAPSTPLLEAFRLVRLEEIVNILDEVPEGIVTECVSNLIECDSNSPIAAFTS